MRKVFLNPNKFIFSIIKKQERTLIYNFMHLSTSTNLITGHPPSAKLAKQKKIQLL